MRRDLAVFLLSIFAISALSAAVPVDIQVSVNPNLPVALYEGPQTYRRDSRGRPFKSIIVTSSKLFGLGNSAGSNFLRDSSTTSSTTSTTTTTTTTTTTPAPPPRRPLDVGQRLKPFIVTSRPFGFANSASNLVRDSPTTTTTTTTTPSPLFDKATPTIPFFSISCTVGSSCSQIISARQTQTAKPTFKPYTKEEINKFKGSLGSRFPPKVTPSTISSETSDGDSTATTEKPATEKPSNVWRIRTTSPPNPTTTAVSASSLSSTTTTRPIKNIPSSNWSSRWKWPTHIGSVASEDHKQDEIESSNQRVETVTSEPTTVAVKSSPQGALSQRPTHFSEFPIRTNTYSVKPYTTREKYDNNKETYPKQRPEGNTKPPVATGNNNWLSLLAASMSVLQNQKQNLNAAQRPQTLQQTKGHPPALPLSTSFPMKTVGKPAKLRPNPTTTPAPEQDRWNSPALTNTEDENSLSWPEKASGFTGYSISLPENDQDYHRHEVISSKGNKISLITGSSTRNKEANKPVKAVQSYQNANRANLPPEVSVSSHVIGLRVKPKSLGGATFIERVQGATIETDGENVNLSDLIMKHDLPPRRARYLPYTQRSFVSYDAKSGWRPVRSPDA